MKKYKVWTTAGMIEVQGKSSYRDNAEGKYFEIYTNSNHENIVARFELSKLVGFVIEEVSE